MQSVPRKADKRPPQLVIVVELEELPRLQVVADTFEDEQRLRRWLAHRSTRRRLADALLDALEEAA
jgi:hypothetical protein